MVKTDLRGGGGGTCLFCPPPPTGSANVCTIIIERTLTWSEKNPNTLFIGKPIDQYTKQSNTHTHTHTDAHLHLNHITYTIDKCTYNTFTLLSLN